MCNVNAVMNIPTSVQMTNFPQEWTEVEIAILFWVNNIGVVRHVEFVPRTNKTVDAYVDLVRWYNNDGAANIIRCLQHEKHRQVSVCLKADADADADADASDDIYIELKNVPKRSKKKCQRKLLVEKHQEALDDAAALDEMWNETHSLILQEQERLVLC
jgi:hypothetical protein